ncbi:hypothetical protein [Streptomyces sp. AS02]|nr:hypothetical protein [Streptomyces sp. AS02]
MSMRTSATSPVALGEAATADGTLHRTRARAGPKAQRMIRSPPPR